MKFTTWIAKWVAEGARDLGWTAVDVAWGQGKAQPAATETAPTDHDGRLAGV